MSTSVSGAPEDYDQAPSRRRCTSREEALAEALVLCGADRAVLQRELRMELTKSAGLRARLGVSTRCLRTLHAQRGEDDDGRGSATVLIEELLWGLRRLEELASRSSEGEDRREFEALHRTIASLEQSLRSSRAECEKLLRQKAAVEEVRDSLQERLSVAADEGGSWQRRAQELEEENSALEARLEQESEARLVEARQHLDEMVSAGLVQENLQKSLKKCQAELAEERGVSERATEGRREKEQSNKSLMELTKELEGSRRTLKGSLEAKEEELAGAQEEIRALQIKSIERQRLLQILDQQCAAYELTLQLQQGQPAAPKTGAHAAQPQGHGLRAPPRRVAPGVAAKKAGQVCFGTDKENVGPGGARAEGPKHGSPEGCAKGKMQGRELEQKRPVFGKRLSPGTRIAARATEPSV